MQMSLTCSAMLYLSADAVKGLLRSQQRLESCAHMSALLLDRSNLECNDSKQEEANLFGQIKPAYRATQRFKFNQPCEIVDAFER